MAASFWSKFVGGRLVKAFSSTPAPKAKGDLPPIRVIPDPLLDDIDKAELSVTATTRDVWLKQPCELIQAAQRDAWVCALLGVRTSGMCTLPALYSGPEALVQKMTAVDEAGVDGFSKVFPLSERISLLVDSITLGVGVAQITYDKATDRKLIVHRAPNHLRVKEGARWFYHNEEIKPGDGEWILLTRGLERPWLKGIWPALTRASVKRMLGEYHRLAFVSALANGVTVLHTPNAASDDDMYTAEKQWSELGTNNLKVLPPGWAADLLEVKSGVGAGTFDKVVSDGRDDISMILCGQTVTSQGSSGSGFINVKYFDAIREDLSKLDSSLFDACVDQQIMPHIAPGVTRRTDLTNDNDKIVTAQRMTQGAAAIAALREQFGDRLDEDALVKQFAIPLKGRNVT